MTKFISRLLLVVAALLVTVVSQAQDNNGSTDVMRSNGKYIRGGGRMPHHPAGIIPLRFFDRSPRSANWKRK